MCRTAIVLIPSIILGACDSLGPEGAAPRAPDFVPPGVQSVSAAVSGYQAIDLGTLRASYSRAVAINGRGQVVVESGGGFLWQNGDVTDLHLGPLDINDAGQVLGVSGIWENGTTTSFGTLGGGWTYASAINARGQVTGQSETAGGQTHGFLWSDGTMVDIGALDGRWAAPTAINGDGWVVGQSLTPDGLLHGFLWNGETMTDLGTLGGRSTSPSDINDVGQVVGWSQWSTDNASRPHAFLWENGRMTDLGTLGGVSSAAVAINQAGQITGQSDNHAFLWSRGVMTDLGTLGGSLSSGVGINNRGQIVGWSLVPGWEGNSHAFVWADGVMTDLGTLGGPHSAAVAINERGEIIGYSRLSDDSPDEHAVLWRPLSPAERVQAMEDHVNAMVAAGTGSSIRWRPSSTTRGSTSTPRGR